MRQFEFVTVCVDYADFLAFTLPIMLQHFDRGVVVTSSKDIRTQNIVRYYNEDQVKLVVTDEMYADGAKFNKGKAINAGLAVLRKDSWVAHLDADIILPPHTRQILQARFLDTHSIYGVDREMCKSFESWLDFMQNPKPINEKYYLVHGNQFQAGARVAHYNQADGWMPIGFFQLWHPKGSGITQYPEAWHGADHTDIVFSKLFPLGKRHLMGETKVIHLESEKGYSGMNWYGRTSKEFKPALCPPPTTVTIEVPCPDCPETPEAVSVSRQELQDVIQPLLEQLRSDLANGYQPLTKTWWQKASDTLSNFFK